MIKYLLPLFTFFSGHFLQASSPIPNEFFVTQHWFSTTTTFDISTKDEFLGIVDRQFLSWTTQYNFYNSKNVKEATAKLRWISVGAVFDIRDENDQLLGIVDERFFSIFPHFDIISKDGEVLASAKMNYWNTTYQLIDPITKDEMARLSRSFIRIKDNWVVKITNPSLFASKNIDPRLFITVMAFQTDVDSWKKN